MIDVESQCLSTGAESMYNSSQNKDKINNTDYQGSLSRPSVIVKSPSWSPTDQNLTVGKTFNTFEDAKKFVKMWCSRSFSPMVVNSSRISTEKKKGRGRILFVCPHGVNRKSKSTGVRPKQNVMFTNCSARINIYEQADSNVWIVTYMNNVHTGHLVGRDVYGTYSTVRKLYCEDEKFMMDLHGAGASNRCIARVLSDKTNKLYDTKFVYNSVQNNIIGRLGAGGFVNDLKEIEENGGTVEKWEDEHGRIDVLFIQLGEWQVDIVKTRPSLFQLDTTFGTNKEGYKLHVPIYKSRLTGRYEAAGLLFMATENQDNTEKGLTWFKESLSYIHSQANKLLFFVDKDFNSIESIYKIFPKSSVYLDWVHVDRYFRDKVFPGAKFDTDRVGDVDLVKKDLYEMIKKCRMSHSLEEYEMNRSRLFSATEGLLVKPGKRKNFGSFKDYFMENWNSVLPMWIKAYRKDILSLDGDHTQAAESFFAVLKKYIKQRFGSRLPFIEELIPELLKTLGGIYCHRRLNKENRRPQYFHEDSNFKEALTVASWHFNPVGMELLWNCIKLYESRLDKMEMQSGDYNLEDVVVTVDSDITDVTINSIDDSCQNQSIDNNYNAVNRSTGPDLLSGVVVTGGVSNSLVSNSLIVESFRGKYFVGERRYRTNGSGCSCSYFSRNLFCRHIIMYRIWRELPIIDIDTIDKRLLKDGSNNDDDNRTTDSVVSRPSSPGSESVHTEEDAPSSMSRAEKYNKAIDIGREIAEVMSHEGPREFIRSLEYCKDIVKKLRDRNLPALDERPHATPNASPLDKSTREETLHTVTMDESSDSPSDNVEFVVPNTCNNEVLLSEVKFPKRAKHTKIALCKAYPEVYKDQERLIFKQVPRGKGRPKNVRYRSKIQRKTPVVNNNLPQVTSRPVVDVWQQDSGVSPNKGPIEVLNEINPIDRPDEKCEGSSNRRSLDNNQEVFNGTDNVTLHSVVNEPNADNGLINAGEEDGWSQYEDSNNAAKFLVRNKAIYPNIIKPFQFNRPLRDLFKTVKIEDEDDVEGIDQYCFFSSSTKEMNDFINFVQNILEYKKTSFVVLTDLKAQTVIKYLYKNINRQKGREYETFPECEELETDLSKL